MKTVLLCGGVGGSKLALGLHHELDGDMTVIVNTGDDLELFGLRMSPDLDTVTYTLARLANQATGWGLSGDTFQMVSMMERYGEPSWFKVGDLDLATHLLRTSLLRSGASLTEATEAIRSRLGVRESILPMTESEVRTTVRIAEGWIAFQEYFVRRGHRDEPLEVRHEGVGSAELSEPVHDALASADLIVVAPSNPVVSIGPMLAVPGFREALRSAAARKVAVSPFIGSQSITGPADALMVAVGGEPTSLGLARMYGDWLDVLIVDESDASTVASIEAGGVVARSTNTIMRDVETKRALASFVLGAAT